MGTLIGADAFYSAGFTGQGTIAANVEAGLIWNGHEALTQATVSTGGNAGLGEADRHATWVGMLMGGRNGGSTQGPWQTGIAPGTDLSSGAFATSWQPPAYSTSFLTTNTPLRTAYSAIFGTADAINSSWASSGLDTTGTSVTVKALDAYADQNPGTTFMASAGNFGPGANTVSAPASGYNGLVVGALANGGDDSYATLWTGSSRGAQDYSDPTNGTVTGVRAVVDLVAPGTGLISAYYGGTSGGNRASLSGSPKETPTAAPRPRPAIRTP